MRHTIPVGTSEPQDFELKNDGAAFDGSSFDIELEITAKDGTAIATAPVAAWLVASAGTVRVTGVETLETGHYYVRFKVTDGTNHDGFFPNGDKADVWSVVAIAS